MRCRGTSSFTVRWAMSGRRLAVGYPPEHSFCSDGFSLGGRFDHRARQGEEVRFALDRLLEEARFEPSVPRKTPAVVVISGLVAPPSPLRQAEPTRAPLSKPCRLTRY